MSAMVHEPLGRQSWEREHPEVLDYKQEMDQEQIFLFICPPSLAHSPSPSTRFPGIALPNEVLEHMICQRSIFHEFHPEELYELGSVA